MRAPLASRSSNVGIGTAGLAGTGGGSRSRRNVCVRSRMHTHRGTHTLLYVDLVRLIDDAKLVRPAAYRFRAAEDQQAIGFRAVVQCGQDPLL